MVNVLRVVWLPHEYFVPGPHQVHHRSEDGADRAISDENLTVWAKRLSFVSIRE